MESSKKVFISHAESTNYWVHELSNWLADQGVAVVSHIYDLKVGMDKHAFIEGINATDIDKALIICDTDYVNAANSREGLEGVTTQISSHQVYKDVNQTYFIPIALELDAKGAPLLPLYLSNRKCINCSTFELYKQGFQKILGAILEIDRYEKPILIKGKTPKAPPYFERLWRNNQVHLSNIATLNMRDIVINNSKQEKLSKELSAFLPKMPASQLVGRKEDLKSIHKILNQHQQVVVVHGMGGLGKTALAQAYVSQYYDQYAHILWVELNVSDKEEDSPTQERNKEKTAASKAMEDSLKDDFVNTKGLLRNLGIEKEEKNLAAVYEDILYQLSKINSRPNLLILDNANASINKHYKYLPKHPNWHLLATSRESLYHFTTHQLDFLSMAEAKQLFKKIYPSDRFTDASLEELIESVEYHTLVITVLATTAKDSEEYDAKRLINAVRKNEEVYIEEDDDKKKQRIKGYLANLFKLNSLSPLHQHLLLQFAYLPADSHSYDKLKSILSLALPPPPYKSNLELTRHYFNKFMSLFNKNKQTQDKPVESPTDPDLSSLLNQLYKKSWLLKEEDTTQPSSAYRMHRIIAEVVREELFKQDIQLEYFIFNIIKHLGITDKEEKQDDRFTWVSYGEALLDRIEDFSAVDQARLYDALIEIYKYRGKYAEAKILVEDLIVLNLEKHGKKHPYTTHSYYLLAKILTHLGQYQKAQKTIDSVIDVEIEIYGHKHPNTITSYYLLAKILTRLGQYKKAKKTIDNVIDVEIEKYGHKHPETINSYQLLAQILNTLGQHKEAKATIENVINVREEIDGHKHPNTINSYFLLTQILNNLGQYQKAKKTIDNLIDVQEEIDGHKHPNSINSYFLLTQILNNLGQYQEAKETIHNVIGAYIEIDGHKHPNTITSYHLLADILTNLGQYQKAKKTIDNVIDVEIEKYGHKHPNTITNYFLLAEILTHLGQYQKAKKTIHNVIDVREEIYGQDHILTASSYSRLARIQYHLHETKEAEKLLHKTITIQEQQLGLQHISLAISYSYLANVLEDLQQLPLALDYMQKAWNIIKETVLPTEVHYRRISKDLEALKEK